MRPLTAIIFELANAWEENRALNKYQLEKRTKKPRQSVYDSIAELKELGWVTIERTEEFRTGRTVEYYRLTNFGLFLASSGSSALARKIRHQLGSEFEKYKQQGDLRHAEEVEKLTRAIREILLSRKAPPNWQFNLSIVSDDKGRIRYDTRWEFPWFKKWAAQTTRTLTSISSISTKPIVLSGEANKSK
jgi:DNA-binding PadR family transcriptional regulator